jgi:iron complex transport system substrate-binding protein
MRVISLVPSATEVLCLIGGRRMLVGRSHECDWPSEIQNVPVLTSQRTPAGASASQIDEAVRGQIESGSSLYSLDAGLALALKPDVILTQDLCRVCSIDGETVREVASRMNPRPLVVSLNPGSLEDVLDDVLRVGEAVGLAREAGAAVVGLRGRVFRAMEYVNPYVQGPSVAFLEWTDPLFVGGHWTPQLIERAGGRHPLNPTVAAEGSGAAMGPQQANRRAGPSRCVSAAELVASRPERVIVCPCGVPLAREVRGKLTVESMAAELAGKEWWGELPAVREHRLRRAEVDGTKVANSTVALVDGNQMFNRPGPRLAEGLEWLVGWLNERPEVIPAGFPWRAWPG